MGLSRLELLTLRLSSVHSNQLSYKPEIKKENLMLEFEFQSKVSLLKTYKKVRLQKELKLFLLNAGWIDAGRIASREHSVKKHIFHSPKLINLSKSDLRRITENNGT